MLNILFVLVFSLVILLSGCALDKRVKIQELKQNPGTWYCEELSFIIPQDTEQRNTATVRYNGTEYELRVSGRDVGITFYTTDGDVITGVFWHTNFYFKDNKYHVKVVADESGVTDYKGKVFVLERQD